MVRAIAIAALCLLPTGALADANQYLCVVEQSAGLHYDKQTNAWGPRVFGVSRKYILRKLTADDRDHQNGKWWGLFQNHEKANWAFLSLEKPTLCHWPHAAMAEAVSPVSGSYTILISIRRLYDLKSPLTAVMSAKATGKTLQKKNQRLTRSFEPSAKPQIPLTPMIFLSRSESAARFSRHASRHILGIAGDALRPLKVAYRDRQSLRRHCRA